MQAGFAWLRRSGDNPYWPPTAKYSGIVRFGDDAGWPDICWAPGAECRSALDDGWTWRADARFLVDKAPVHHLAPGNRFDLVEIREVVGRGIIVAADP